jgi:Na+/melibiose symporter-like transporter
VEQATRTLFGIRLFFGPVPLLFLLLSLPLLVWFPITRKKHLELRKQLEAQEIKP